MRALFALLLLFSLGVYAQDEPPLDEMEVEAGLVEEEFDDEEMDEPPEDVRTPPSPVNRFRTPSKRFGTMRPSFGGRSGGRSGGGVDSLGKTEGEIKFKLADPPLYYKGKNRPYLMPPPSTN